MAVSVFQRPSGDGLTVFIDIGCVQIVDAVIFEVHSKSSSKAIILSQKVIKVIDKIQRIAYIFLQIG